jgi:hypothetical protein
MYAGIKTVIRIEKIKLVSIRKLPPPSRERGGVRRNRNE